MMIFLNDVKRVHDGLFGHPRTDKQWKECEEYVDKCNKKIQNSSGEINPDDIISIDIEKESNNFDINEKYDDWHKMNEMRLK